jgi:hypothetical protein
VGTEQVGWVLIPTDGAVGVTGCSFITTSDEVNEEQPAELITVKLYVPAGIPPTVLVAPVPVIVTPPGFLISVQVPVGNPDIATLPVERLHVG